MEPTSLAFLRQFAQVQWWLGKGAAGLAVALHCGGLRFAPSALRCSGPGPSGITRCVRCALFAQTDAASQLTRRASAPALNPALLGAAQARHSKPGRAFAPTEVAVEEVKDPLFEPPLPLLERRAVPVSGAVCVGEKRRHAVGARSALCRLTRRGCLSAAPAGRVASSATRPRAEHRSAVGAQHRPTQPAPLPGTARRDVRQPTLPRRSNNNVHQSSPVAGIARSKPSPKKLRRPFQPQGAH